jgi:N-acetylneuraminic acid mutarotase
MKLQPALLCAFASLYSFANAEVPQATVPPPMPAPVASFGAAATPDGHVFIYGGHAGVRHKYNKEEVNGNLHGWKSGDTKWADLGKDEPAQGASLLALPGKVLRIGGMAARNSKTEAQDLWSSETASFYDLKTNTWTALPKLPERRSSHDSAIIGDTLYVIGGWALNGGGTRSAEPSWHVTYLTLDLSKPDAQWKSHEQPFKRRALAVQAIGTQLYAIGGMSDDEEPVTHVSILDTTTGKWTDGPALPTEKLGGFGFSAVAHEGRLFASGVAGELMELRGKDWVPVLKLAHPRFFHRLLPGGEHKLIALGGESRKGEKAPPEITKCPSYPTDPLPHPPS